ncbi:MAG: proline--tRNA ligase [Planctomycetota bacterium]
MAERMGVTPRSEDYSAWYQDTVQKAELADYAPVRGCMVIRPYGYALWEAIQAELDRRFKETGHVNAYFPLFIPESFMKREAEHVEGFAPECAVVTHGGGKELEEPLMVRPTSETIIGHMYAKWISSWRDLPLLVNQWANVVRWELRTRLFLRTLEFLWQEGHTAHETAADAQAETLRMLGVYRDFCEGFLAIPVMSGLKSESERFAGAESTYCIEALMQDGKALQAGTSHNLGQKFAKAFNIQFQGRDKKLEYAWTTSWGMSTRVIGALVMVHGDDQGLVLPPKVAPYQVVLVPIWKSDAEQRTVLQYCERLASTLRNASVRVKVDDRDQYKPGFKFNDWELRGVPLRLEVGPRDVRGQGAVLVRRDTGEKASVGLDDLARRVQGELGAIQQALFEKARRCRDSLTRDVDDYEEFKRLIEAPGGFLRAHWDGTRETEARIKEETKATIRVIPIDAAAEPGRCLVTGRPSGRRVIFARAY